MKEKKYVLIIDITVFGVFRIGILTGETFVSAREFLFAPSSSFLSFLVRYLRLQKIKEDNVRGIALIAGRGSFSAVRAAVSVLNVLQWVKVVPVASFDCRNYADIVVAYKDIAHFSWRRNGMPLHALYQGSPHITTPKNKAFAL